MTDTAVTVEPERVEVVRWRCPFCRRSHSGRGRAREHMTRCWFNPAARSCKTCVHFQEATSSCYADPSCNCASPEICSAGVDLEKLSKLPIHCPKWEPASEHMVCDGCDAMFPEEKLTATEDGRALLCPACHREAEES